MVNDPLAPPPPGTSVTAPGDIASVPCPPPFDADDDDAAGEVAGADDVAGEVAGAVVVAGEGVSVTPGAAVAAGPGESDASGVTAGVAPEATPEADGASPRPPPDDEPLPA